MSNFTNKTIIGRILPNPRGTWSIDAAYDRLDFVLFNGNGYVCKEDNTGYVPSSYPKYWTLVSVRGEKGEKGDVGNSTIKYKGEWNRNTEYNKLDSVRYDGDTYIFNEDGDHFTNNPTEDDRWELMCKGTDYTLNENNEVVLIKSGKTVYPKTTSEHVLIDENTTLKKKIIELEERIEWIEFLFKYYDIWKSSEEFGEEEL